MDVTLPGQRCIWTLDWVAAEGALVAPGDVVAWLSRADVCGTVALRAPEGGRLVARWSALLPAGPSGAVVAVIAGDPSRCRADESAALERLIADVRIRLDSLTGGRHPAAAVLLHDERRALEAELRRLEEAHAGRR